MASLLIRQLRGSVLAKLGHQQNAARFLSSMIGERGCKILEEGKASSTRLFDGNIRSLATASTSKPASGQSSSGGGGSARSFVESEIKKYPIVMFALQKCKYCENAKRILNKYKLIEGKNYAIHNLDDHKDLKPMQAYFQESTGSKSLPRIYVGGKCIGGADEAAKLDETGQLSRMLQKYTPQQSGTTS